MNDEGDLSAYLAAGLLLPMVLLLTFGGLGLISLMHAKATLLEAAQQGLIGTEMAGGVTSSVRSLVHKDASADALLADGMSKITGSTPLTPWGQSVWIRVQYSLPLSGSPWTWMGISDPYTLSITLIGNSNLPP